jgi:hypothetical protein
VKTISGGKNKGSVVAKCKDDSILFGEPDEFRQGQIIY